MRSIFASLHWLKDKLLIDELKLDQTVDFMVNPYVITNEGDQKDRIKEWSRRVRLADD